jgi:hypothetical protein
MERSRSRVAMIVGVTTLVYACHQREAKTQSQLQRSSSVPWTCTSPGDLDQPTVEEGRLADLFGGDFNLRVVATQGEIKDSIAEGHMQLNLSDALHATFLNPYMTAPLYGWTDANFLAVGDIAGADSVGSHNQDFPGVQVNYDRNSSLVTLMFGGPENGIAMSLHSGVIAALTRIDSTGFDGTWMENSNRRRTGPLLGGYFCARRPVPK